MNMQSKFIDQVLIPQGERYVIGVTKDHNSGLVVQVARKNPTHVRGDNGAVYKGHEPVIIWQAVVSFGTKKQNGDIDFRDAGAIDSDLKLALSRAQQYAQKAIQTENAVDAILTALDAEVNK